MIPDMTKPYTKRLERAGVVRDGDAWEYDVWQVGAGMNVVTCEFENLAQGIKEPLAVLLTAPVGYYNAQIGRRVTEDIFWVHHE